MATATYTLGLPSVVIPTLAIDTNETTYTFTCNRPGQIQLVSNVAWWYADVTNGPYYPVGVGQPFLVTTRGTTFIAYVKAQTTSGTIYGVVAS
jgi:hypothetical protein